MKNFNVSDDISSIYKGKLSLAEALKDLDTVKKAFEISERIECRLSAQDEIINILQSRNDLYAPYTFVVSKLEEAKTSMAKLIKDKVEEFSAQYLTQLNEKLSRNEIEPFISNRCTWSAFNTLSQNVGSLKARIDKHVFSDFEGLKTKMKVQFGDKHNEILNESMKLKEEFSNFKVRLTVVEQKLHEMFVDDGLGDSEDYDSQEENDDIMNNLDGNHPDSLGSSSEEDPNGAPKTDSQVKNQSPQITVSELKRNSISEVPAEKNNNPANNSVPVIQAPSIVSESNNSNTSSIPTASTIAPISSISASSSIPQHPSAISSNPILPNPPTTSIPSAPISAPPEQVSIPPVLASISAVSAIPSTPSIPNSSVPNSSIPNPSIPILSSNPLPQALERKISDISAPERKISDVSAPESKANEAERLIPDNNLISANPQQKINDHMKKQTINDNTGSISKSNALEIPDRSYKKHDDENSSRHKKSSSHGDHNLSRKNSLSSTNPGNATAAGGLRGINKKVTSLQKEIELYKVALDDSKLVFEEYKSEIGKAYDKIAILRERCEEIEKNRQGMELSFIKALRRSGKDKKPIIQQQIASISSEDMKKIYSQLSDKTQKIINIESNLERVILELELTKSTLREKINEVVASIHVFDNFRKDQIKEVNSLKCNVEQIQESFKLFNIAVHKEVETIKGPMTDLISDQLREKEILEENLKRQQVNFREIFDDYSTSMKNLIPENLALHSRLNTARPQTRKSNDSPRVSVKHKFFEINNTYRLSNPNLKADENWLASFPDGKTIALPKVGIISQKKKSVEIDPKKSL